MGILDMFKKKKKERDDSGLPAIPEDDDELELPPLPELRAEPELPDDHNVDESMAEPMKAGAPEPIEPKPGSLPPPEKVMASSKKPEMKKKVAPEPEPLPPLPALDTYGDEDLPEHYYAQEPEHEGHDSSEEEKPRIVRTQIPSHLFVSVNDYQRILEGVNFAKAKLAEADDNLKSLTLLKAAQKKEIDAMRSLVEDVQRKITYVDEVIFQAG